MLLELTPGNTSVVIQGGQNWLLQNGMIEGWHQPYNPLPTVLTLIIDSIMSIMFASLKTQAGFKSQRAQYSYLVVYSVGRVFHNHRLISCCAA